MRGPPNLQRIKDIMNVWSELWVLSKEVCSQKKGGFLKKTQMKSFLVGVNNSMFSLTSWKAEADVRQ